jgi:hypothetical protein
MGRRILHILTEKGAGIGLPRVPCSAPCMCLSRARSPCLSPLSLSLFLSHPSAPLSLCLSLSLTTPTCAHTQIPKHTHSPVMVSCTTLSYLMPLALQGGGVGWQKQQNLQLGTEPMSPGCSSSTLMMHASISMRQMPCRRMSGESNRFCSTLRIPKTE